MTDSIVPASGRFQALELRTTDLASAAAFYGRVLGMRVEGQRDDARLVRDGGPCSFLSLLPEAARLRGAPPHWLGHLGVDDVAGLAAELRARGLKARAAPAGKGPPRLVRIADPDGNIITFAEDPRPSPGA